MDDFDKPLLSICIPTFNRDYLLKVMLMNIVPIAKKFNIPIFISDNCSPDNTEDIVKEITSLYTNIIYYRQEKNIGPDMNFEFLLKNSESKYKWLLGDGNSINEDKIESLLNILKNNDYEFVITGYNNRTEDINTTVYDNPSILLGDLGWHMTQISCLIYSEKVIPKLNFERYRNSNFLQTGIIFEYLAANLNSRVLFTNELKVYPLNLEKRGHWIENVLNIFGRNWYLFIMSLPLYYEYENKMKCIKSHSRKTSLYSLHNCLIYRAKLGVSFSQLKKNYFFVKQTTNMKDSINLFLVSLIPLFIFSIRKRVKARINGCFNNNCKL